MATGGMARCQLYIVHSAMDLAKLSLLVKISGGKKTGISKESFRLHGACELLDFKMFLSKSRVGQIGNPESKMQEK